MREARLLYLEFLIFSYDKIRLAYLDIAVVCVELTLEECPVSCFYLEKKPNSPVLVNDEKPENRSSMPPVKKSRMSVMESIMEC